MLRDILSFFFTENMRIVETNYTYMLPKIINFFFEPRKLKKNEQEVYLQKKNVNCLKTCYFTKFFV